MRVAVINLELNLHDVFDDLDFEHEPGKMFAGFTAGTGRYTASHAIESWRFFEVDCADEEDAEKPLGFFDKIGEFFK